MLIEPPSGLLATEFRSFPIFERALQECARRLGTEAEALRERLALGGDPEAHSAFRYALAKAVAGYLSGLGGPFRAVYVHGSAVNDRAGPCSDVDVIVLVEYRRDEALRVLRLVDAVVSAGYRAYFGRPGPVSLLDVHIVDLDEEREGRGYGAVLQNRWSAPLCLWRSTPSEQGAFPRGGPLRSPTPVNRR